MILDKVGIGVQCSYPYLIMGWTSILHDEEFVIISRTLEITNSAYLSQIDWDANPE